MQGAVGCTNSLAPIPKAVNSLAVLRTAIEALLATSEHISDQEYQTAAQRVNACQSLETLQKWHRNCAHEIARRGTEATSPAAYATPAQREEIITLLNHVLITRQEKTKALLNINRLDGPQAVALVGNLYQKVLDRGGVAHPKAADMLTSLAA
ncbi:hypothetical protein AXW84_18460 [Hymenobacter sp. PAMC 26628]|nr:hypothetical protein AXW84_18460 [Hymenobacter sp. PAMC 26628]